MKDRIADLPCWTGTLKVEPLSGGLSNEIWKVTDAAGPWVVRFGADYPFHHVSRDREAMVARAAAAAGIAPEVRHAAEGAMVTRFVEGRTWGAADVCANPERLARLIRSFHDRMPAEVSGAAFLFWPFHVVRDYLRQLGQAASDGNADLARWAALCRSLESVQPPLPFVFGHNDLLPANLIEGADGHLWLIDYEYAGFGTCLFDLAGAASNAGMDDKAARALVGAYLGRRPGTALLRAFDAMQVTSLLREMLWARVSALHLSAPGVDYATYAAENAARLVAALDAYQTRNGALP